MDTYPEIGTYYPKKVRDTLTIEVLTSLGFGEYQVKNAKGEVCKKGYIGEGMTIIDCRMLEIGIYTVVIKDCDKPPLPLTFEKY